MFSKVIFYSLFFFSMTFQILALDSSQDSENYSDFIKNLYLPNDVEKELLSLDGYLTELLEKKDPYDIRGFSQLLDRTKLSPDDKERVVARMFLAVKNYEKRKIAADALKNSQLELREAGRTGAYDMAFHYAVIAATLAAATYFYFESGSIQEKAVTTLQPLNSLKSWFFGTPKTPKKKAVKKITVKQIGDLSGVIDLEKKLKETEKATLEVIEDRAVLTLLANSEKYKLPSIEKFYRGISGALGGGQGAEQRIEKELLDNYEKKKLPKQKPDPSSFQHIANTYRTNEPEPDVIYSSVTRVVVSDEAEWLMLAPYLKGKYTPVRGCTVEESFAQVTTLVSSEIIDAVGKVTSSAGSAATKAAAGYLLYNQSAAVTNLSVAAIGVLAQVAGKAVQGASWIAKQPGDLIQTIKRKNSEESRLNSDIKKNEEYLSNFRPSGVIEEFEVRYISLKRSLDPQVAFLIERYLKSYQDSPNQFSEKQWILDLALELPQADSEVPTVNLNEIDHPFRNFDDQIRDFLRGFVRHAVSDDVKNFDDEMTSSRLFFEGPKASGKSEAAKRLATVLNRPLIRVNFVGKTVDDIAGFDKSSPNARPGLLVDALVSINQKVKTSYANMILLIEDFDKLDQAVQTYVKGLLKRQTNDFYSPFFNINIKLPSIIVVEGKETPDDFGSKVHFKDYTNEQKEKIVREEFLPQNAKDLYKGIADENDLKVRSWLHYFADSNFENTNLLPNSLFNDIHDIIVVTKDDLNSLRKKIKELLKANLPKKR